MYTFKTLEDVCFHQLCQSMNSALATPQFPFKLTPHQLTLQLQQIQADLSASYGVYLQENLVGFMLNSTGVYQEETVAFQLFSGIVPQYRNQGLFSKLFRYAAKQLANKEVQTYFVELPEDNTTLFQIYSGFGMNIAEKYQLFYTNLKAPGSCTKVFKDKISTFSKQQLESLSISQPSYQNRLSNLMQQEETLSLAYTIFDNRLTSYAIFENKTGTILHTGRASNCLSQLWAVFLFLEHKYGQICTSNINIQDKELVQALAQQENPPFAQMILLSLSIS